MIETNILFSMRKWKDNNFITSIALKILQMYTGFKPNTSVSKTMVSGIGETQL